MEAETCGQCCFYMPNKNKHGSEGLCWRFPPTVFPLPVQGVVGAAPRMMNIVMRPTVCENHFCGEMMPKVDVTQN